MFEESLNKNKAFRQLNIYERLNRGEKVFKETLANDFGVSLKTIQRDIDDLRAYLSEMHFDEATTTIKYDRANNYYYLVRCKKEWLTNEEALSLCKILLESRAFKKEEMTSITEKLLLHIHPTDRSRIEQMIRNELFHYIPLKHNKSLLSPVWDLSENIVSQNVIEFNYIRQDGKRSTKKVKPVSIMFSEFYFYLIAFSLDGDKDFPIIYRIDRMTDIKATGEKFVVPYKDKFNDGEFRKRIQFMYSGELKTVRFEYSGVLEAILDRLPTAKILKEDNGVYTLSAETYGDGIYMWLRSQGDKVKALD